MKENRIGVIVCGLIAVLSLALTVVFNLEEVSNSFTEDVLMWCLNFSFAIMGSACLSFVICLVNYLIIRKKLIEELANGLYVFDNDINTEIYRTRKNKSTENLATIIGMASKYLVELAYKAYAIKVGFFKFEKTRTTIIESILTEIEGVLQYRVYSIGIALRTDAENVGKKIDEYYGKIEKLIEDMSAYKDAFKLAKSVGSVVKQANWGGVKVDR